MDFERFCLKNIVFPVIIYVFLISYKQIIKHDNAFFEEANELAENIFYFRVKIKLTI